MAMPIGLAAQPAKVPLVGALVVGAPGSEPFWRLFRDDMRKLGYIDGQSVRYEFRSDQGQIARLPELAAELVQLKVDVIVTWLTPAALAAKQATREIPIVMASAGDPVAAGLITSLARPGGNVTGIAGMADLAGKCVELSHDLLPQAHHVVALVNAPDPFSKVFLDKISDRGQGYGYRYRTRPDQQFRRTRTSVCRARKGGARHRDRAAQPACASGRAAGARI